YNEVHPWRYTELTKVYGGGVGHLVENEGEFQTAIDSAWKDADQVHLIQAKLLENDASETLKKLADRMSHKVSGEPD
ncbi:MAG: alpha-keto acid decarboxylase family protein, partial [Rubripirellula sp.]|nr:alpha-keto acid decarboxylase family protein [Rubripirellula sp.]